MKRQKDHPRVVRYLRAEEDREQLFIGEQEVRLEAEVVRDANLALTQDLSLDRILETLLDHLHKLVPYDSANVMLTDGDSRFVVSAIRGYESFLPDVGLAKIARFDANANALFRRIYTTGQSLLITDTEDEPAWQRTPGGEHIRNWLGLPLVANGKVIGMYSLDKTHPGYFTAKHVRTAESLAAQAASAIKNARLFRQVELYAAELEQRIIEPRRAEESLRLFRSLIDRSSDAIEVIDPTTLRFLDCNESAYQTLGYSREEFLSLTVFDIDPTIDPARHAQINEEMERSGSAIFESLHLRKDGSAFPVEVNVKVVRLERDYRLAVVRDITERKRTEEALRQVEAKYHSIFDNAVEGIFQTTPDGQFITANSALASMLGYDSPEELLSSRTDIARQHYVEPERRSEFKRLLEECGVVREFEHQAYRKDGSKIWLSENVRVVRGEGGAALYYEGFTEDITERKRVEEALRESEERYRDMVENALDIIYSHDLEGNYTSVNKAGEQITGYTREEALKLNLAQTIPPEYLTKARQMISRKLAGEKVTAYDLEVIAKDGRRIAVEVNTHLVYQDGMALGVQGIARDITERKRAEEQIRATSEQLRALSARLQSAREEERARIAREIHDELGSALTSLKWDLEGMDKVFSDSEHPPHFPALRKKIEAMTRLIDTTVNVVRRISSELRPSLLDDLGLAEAIEWQAQQFQARTGIICRCDCSLENVVLSREQSTAVFRIFQEALTNILRHAQATGVEIAAQKVDGEVTLTIRDNGRAITEEEKSGWLSLGLLGMSERAHLVGGRVDITGVEGSGTVVTVRVPISG